MDRAQLLSLALFVVLVAAFLLFQRAGQIDGAEARRLVHEGARLVDVRSAGEFAGGHLDGAVNVPLSDLQARLDAVGPRERPVVVYCASGARSAMARSTLRNLGYAQVHNLGAMSRW